LWFRTDEELGYSFNCLVRTRVAVVTVAVVVLAAEAVPAVVAVVTVAVV
jgi:hypothetical protein